MDEAVAVDGGRSGRSRISSTSRGRRCQSCRRSSSRGGGGSGDREEDIPQPYKEARSFLDCEVTAEKNTHH